MSTHRADAVPAQLALLPSDAGLLRTDVQQAHARRWLIEQTMVLRRRGDLDFLDALEALTAAWHRAADLYEAAA